MEHSFMHGYNLFARPGIDLRVSLSVHPHGKQSDEI